MHNNNNVIVTKWKYKREICFISSEHKSKKKPEINMEMSRIEQKFK